MESLLPKLIYMSLAGAVMILVVLLLRRLFKRAPKWTVLLLWGLVALRLVLPFVPESRLSIMPKGAEDIISEKLAFSSAASPEATISPLHTAVPGAEAHKPTQLPQSTEAASAIKTAEATPEATFRPQTDEPQSTVTAAPAPIAGTQDKPGGKRGLLKAAAYIWAAGSAAMLAYAVISWYALKRKLDTAVLLQGNVYESENVVSPFLLGLIRPKIYLPFGLDETSRGYVTAHEKAHIKGLDHLWKPLGFLILSLHWPNPLAWVGYAVFCRDIELNCDERVAVKLDSEARAGYTQTLLDLSISRRRITACPLAFGESNAKERVKNMLNYKKPAFWVIAAALLAAALMTGCFLTSPKKEGEHMFITMTEAEALAADNGWVVIPDDLSYSISMGAEEWDSFVGKVNEKEPAEVVLVMERTEPTQGKYKNLKDELGVRPAVFKKVAFDGKKYTLSESSVYPLDFENEKRYDYFGSVDYPGGECRQYYLADEELTVLSDNMTSEEFSYTLSQIEGDFYPLFNLGIPTVDLSKEPYAYAESRGWVAVDFERFVCGKETWKLFLDKVGAKEPAEVTIVRPDLSTLLLDSYQSGMKVDTVFVIRLVFDGNGFTVCKSVGNTDSFGEEREFTYLESEIGDTDDGRTYINYILTRKPLKELQSMDVIRETLRYEEECFSLFCVIAADMYKLSELPREGIIAFLEDNEIYVDPMYYDESFDLNEAVKAVEGIPEALWEADEIPYYTLYDLNYAASLYDGSIEKPQNPPLSHMGEAGCLEKLKKLGVEIPDNVSLDLRDWVRQLENDINTPCPYESGDMHILFESIRCELFTYYGMTGLMLYESRAEWDAYREAAMGLLGGDIDMDLFDRVHDSYITLANTEDVGFSAWDLRREYTNSFGCATYYKYDGLLARYPAELWEACTKELSYQDQYANGTWEPGKPYLSPYPNGLISGDDSILCMGEPWHDRTVSVIMHMFSDGEWRKFGSSNRDYPYTPTGMCILNDNVGFVCYGNRWEYKDYEGEHETNWVNVWATYDGGNTWKNLDLYLPEVFSEAHSIPRALSPVFQDEVGVIPVVSYTSGSLCVAWFVTEDGGVTWSLGGCSKSDSARQTLSFDKLIPPISAELDLPYPLVLRTEKGDETFLHIFVYPEEGGYIYDSEGRLVGCYKASPGEISDDPKVAFCFIAGGHWRVLIDEMYEPVENDYGCVAAITLAWGVDVIPGQAFAENECRLCDAVIARNPETGAVFELAFDKDMLTWEQLEAIARSIFVK